MTDVDQRVLVVDDEPTVREVVGRYLAREGFDVLEVADGGAVIGAVVSFRPDLIVLDEMLPSRSGFDVLRELRLGSTVPVIMLTARSEEPDRVMGLELGADDYLVKPFSPRELAARVRSVLRRSRSTTARAERPGTGRTIDFADLSIDQAAREVRVRERVVGLTAKEFDLLAHFASHPRQVFSRGELLHHVWDSAPEYQDPATVTVHVRRVRGKIETDPEHPRWIVTVFGVGYRFEP